MRKGGDSLHFNVKVNVVTWIGGHRQGQTFGVQTGSINISHYKKQKALRENLNWKDIYKTS